MPVVAWRFQCDPPLDEPDPDVTVFVSSSYTNDTTGEEVVPKDTSSYAVVKLSALSSFLTAPTMPDKPKVPV